MFQFWTSLNSRANPAQGEQGWKGGDRGGLFILLGGGSRGERRKNRGDPSGKIIQSKTCGYCGWIGCFVSVLCSCLENSWENPSSWRRGENETLRCLLGRMSGPAGAETCTHWHWRCYTETQTLLKSLDSQAVRRGTGGCSGNRKEQKLKSLWISGMGGNKYWIMYWYIFKYLDLLCKFYSCSWVLFP